MKVEQIKIKYVNPLRKERKHEKSCDVYGYKQQKIECKCVEKKYECNYNFNLTTRKFLIVNPKVKKYSILCKVDNSFYYCYNLNEMVELGFIPIDITFDGSCFSWRLDGVDGLYKSGVHFKLNKEQLTN